MPFLVAIHEMGHAYLQVKGIGYPKSQTYALEEIVANYFLYAFLRTKQPNLAKVWDNILEGYVVTQCLAHSTIKDFDDLYFGVTQKGGFGNFFWYQGMFQRMAKTLFESEGLGFVKKMDEIVKLGNMADPKLVYQKLIELNPAFKDWIENFGPDSHCP